MGVDTAFIRVPGDLHFHFPNDPIFFYEIVF